MGLATDKPRPAYLGHEGGNVQVVVPRELCDSLFALGRQNGVTPFMLFLTAFAVLLYRYSGQTDIAIGTPIAGRTQATLEDLIGFFVNTLVMSVDLSGDSAFTEVLGRVRDIALEAYEHQELPFEKLVEELAPIRDTSRNPLFQVLLAFQNMPESPLELKGLEVSRFPFEQHSSKFDLSLTLRDSAEGLVGNFSYNKDLFEAESIERMSVHYRLLLESIAADPGRPIHALNLLSDSEVQTLVVEWNATAQPYDENLFVHTLIERQADRGPDRTAIVHGGTTLSYQKLNERANRLAHYLIESGVGTEDLVGICLERMPGMLVAVLAVFKAGGAYLPLDPTYPSARLAYMLQDSAAKVVISCSTLRSRLPEQHRARVLELDRLEAALAKYPTYNPGLTVSARQLAYVIYTSGSTGRPKGVMIEHRALADFIHYVLEFFTDEERAVVLASTSLSFDMSVLELFATLAGGGRMLLVDNVLQLHESAHADEVTLINAVPSVLRALVSQQAIPSSVRVIRSGGEALSSELADALYASTAITRLVDGYGPTEATSYATHEVRELGGMVTIGRPNANTRIYILDSNLNPVPPSVLGELYIAGHGLARGYLNRPDLTAERFINVSFAGIAKERCYRTGDLAKYLADGRIVLLGRFDDQVKVRGYRVETGEVEAALRQFSGVRQGLVTVHKDLSDNNQLIAYVECDGAVMDVEALTRHLAQWLPVYMVPGQIEVLEHFPLLPNGKVDRSRLPDPGERRSTVEFEPPATETEKRLAEIWCELLGVERVGCHDDFFESGGHSLLAVRVVNRVNRECGASLALRTLFEQPTITGLANAIEEFKKAAGGVSGSGEAHGVIPAIPRVARKGPNFDD